MLPNIDRLPTKPNRYAVYDDNHNFIRYEYHERADEPIVEGSPLNKAKLDEFLAASGETSGTASALTLAQPGFLLKDGATVRIKLHTNMAAGATLDVQGTGAKAIKLHTLKEVDGSCRAGVWVQLIYSSANDCYVLQTTSDLGKNEGAKIKRSTNQSIPRQGSADVVFETVVFDRGNLFDASDKTKLTVPSDGLYLAIATCSFEPSTDGVRRAFFCINGDIDYSHGMIEPNPSGSSDTMLTFSAIYNLKQGDFIGVRAAHSSNVSRDITSSSLTLIKVG